ncbi:MAG: hypothetical protein RLZZ453_710 [Chlamydiota bacterium]|jgi:hypothetical protein
MSPVNPPDDSPFTKDPTKTTGELSSAQPSFKNVDPSGVWTAFLSQGGHPPTPEQVKLFLQSLMKQMSLQIQHELQLQKEAARRLRRALEGEQ